MSLTNFEKRLGLVAYFRHQCGVSDPLDPSQVQSFYTWLNELPEGRDDEGRSFVHSAIKDRAKEPLRRHLLRYDQNLRRHVDRLNEQREERITLRYFQTLAALMTEAYLDRATNDAETFVDDLNAFVAAANEDKSHITFPEFAPTDLNKVAYWMATGSGKTLLMHLNYFQYLDYRGGDVDHILLVTPNEGLSNQHLQAMARSSVPGYHFVHEGGGDLLAGDHPVKVIEITKLVEEKTGEGLSVPTEAFEGNNLVFVDEGHKGAGSTAEAWRNRRQELAGAQGFTFEYSATFGQAMGGAPAATEEEYGKAILFDYSYPRFYEDGYGKDYRILNLKDDIHEELTRRYQLANLLTFYEQSSLYSEKREVYQNEYNIAPPLLVFIGHSVTAGKTRSQLSKNDKQSISDVQELTQFLHDVLTNDGDWVPIAIDAILDGEAGLTREDGSDLFADSFSALRAQAENGEAIYRDILQRFFHVDGPTTLHLVNLKGGNAEGEIGLRAGGQAPFFGVINIGDETNFLSGVEEELPSLHVTESQFERSLFKELNRSDSSIQVLLGAKKFIEGWSSWRVSTMGLMNIGRSEGAQIIQLFGRGVRLKGKDSSLKRSSALDGDHPDQLPLLETLNIFGVRADYMAQFRDYLAEEGIDVDERTTVEIPTRINDSFVGKELLTVRRGGVSDRDFVKEVRLRLAVSDTITPSIDLRVGMEMLVSSNEASEQVTASAPAEEQQIPARVLPLVDWEHIYQELWTFRDQRGYSNLIMERSTLRELIQEHHYTLHCPEDLLTCKSYRDLRRIEQLIIMIQRKYVASYYGHQQRQWEDQQLGYEQLDTSDANFIEATEAHVKRTSNLLEVLEDMRDDDALYEEDEGLPDRVYFDRHLYHPLLKEVDGSAEEKPVKYSPPALNTGEWTFVKDLRSYLQSKEGAAFMADKELYLLRNQSRGHGVGFLVGDDRYYPDFILWLKAEEIQHIAFIDPKGLQFAGNLQANDKVQFARQVKRYEAELNIKAGRDDVRLHAFIVSQTVFEDLRKKSELDTRAKFEEHHIYFPEAGSQHIARILEHILRTDAAAPAS